MSRSRLHQWPRGPTTPLHEAANFGSTAVTVALLSSGSFDIDQGDPRGFTPLILAAFEGHASVARILLNKGANVFIKEDQGATALFFAVQQGHLDVTKLLVTAGSDFEARNSVDQTPLFKAAVKGYTEVARVLIEAGADLNNRGPYGATPLWAAANGGHKEIAAMLLDAKANPLLIAHDDEGTPSIPLNEAAQNGHVDVVVELIQHAGIEGCGGASRGIDALCLAAEFQHVGVMAVLTNAGVVDTGQALCTAADHGREGSVKFLLLEQQLKGWASNSRGGYVHATGPHVNRTPLCCSIHGYSPRVVRRLLDAGADTTAGVHVSRLVWGGTCNETPLAYTVDFIKELTADGKGANEETLHKLEAIRRLLLQVDSVHAVSWLWPGDASSGGADGAEEGTRRTEMAPAAGTPLLSPTLPILRRRAARRGVLLAGLWRYSAKISKKSAPGGGKGACCHEK